MKGGSSDGKRSDAGRLYFGGEIYTVDERRPTAEAVAVRDGMILAVGSRDECRASLGQGFDPVDLRGAALLPGFTDTHLHPLPLVYYDMNVNLRRVQTLEEMQDRFRRAAATAPPGRWIVGLDFDEHTLLRPTLPSRHDLDTACPDRPALIVKHDGHMVIANTRALETAGVSAATEDPPGGIIDREDDDTPAGPFREAASQIPLSAVPVPELDDLIQGARHTFSSISSRGITSVGAVMQAGEEGPLGTSGSLDTLAMSMLLEHARFNLYGLLIASELREVEEVCKTALHGSEPGAHRIGGIKIYVDGTFGSLTSYMVDPFSDHPHTRGMLTKTPEEIYRRMLFAHRAGLQIALHVIGDAAMRTCLDLYDRLLSEHPRSDHRHRLEHASILDQAALREMARLGLVVSAQPMFIHSEKNWLHDRLGPERARRTYPFRSILDAGVKLAGASDAPVESTDVLHALQCCVTREGFETQQGITAAQAVRMYTLDAAFAQFEEQVKGSLTPGKRADMVVLTENPVSVPPEKIRDIQVLRTIWAGRVAYEADERLA